MPWNPPNLPFVILAVLVATSSIAHAGPPPAGSAFTYQGKLTENGSPPMSLDADLKFRLFDADEGGSQIGVALEAHSVELSVDGTFTVDLDFGVEPFTGAERWLEIDVRSPHDPSDVKPFETLFPRQPIMPTPYALFALNSPVSWIDKGNGDIAYTDGNIGIGISPPSQALHVGGNVRVDGWIGTDMDAPVEMYVNNSRAFRIEYADMDFGNGPTPSGNVIGGSDANYVKKGVLGASIGGGGFDDGINRYPNFVTDSFCTIGGGIGNQVGGGFRNTASGGYSNVNGGSSNIASSIWSAVGGGRLNNASGMSSTVSGGKENTANGEHSTVAGGSNNTAKDHLSTVSGGGGNSATGFASTVGGGIFNIASTDYSTVAGGDGNFANDISSHNRWRSL